MSKDVYVVIQDTNGEGDRWFVIAGSVSEEVALEYVAEIEMALGEGELFELDK